MDEEQGDRSERSDFDLDAPSFVELYDELALWSAPFGLMLLDRVPLGRDLTILDIGAGTGFTTVELAQRCGSGSLVIAVDPWSGAMERLRRKVEQFGLDNVRLIVGDAAEVAIDPASVDLIVSNLGINNFDNAAAVLANCHRVAKPGARLFLTTNLRGHMAELYDELRATLVDLGLESRLPVLEAHVDHRASIDSLRALLAAAGFEVTTVNTANHSERYADGSALLGHRLSRIGFLPAWRAIPLPADVERVFEVLAARLNARAREHGELRLTVPMACVEARKIG